MEIAVTLPDEIAERADALAARWGVSRSKLIEDAIRLYLDVRESQTAHGALGVDPLLTRAQAKALKASE